MKPWLIGIAILAFAAGAGTLFAQEVQVPLDQAGKIMVIDARLEGKLQLFTEYERFVEAKLYREADSSYVLEILFREGHEVRRDRRVMTETGCQAFRRQVGDRVTEAAPQSVYDQEGRASFIATNLWLAVGYYGWAIPVGFDMRGSGAVTASYLFMSGLGFFVPYVITENTDVTKGMAYLGGYGGTRGIWHGMGVTYLLGGEEVDDDEGRVLLINGVLFSVAETWIGYNLASSSHMSEGTAAAIGLLGDIGALEGLGLAHISGMLESSHEREAAGMILGGSAVGLIAGARLAGTQHYTRGDASVMGNTAFLGAAIPATIAYIAETDEDETYTIAAMTGALIGLGIGNRLVKNRNFTTGQGRLIALGETAGALLGLGIASIGDTDDGRTYAGWAMSGATAGFILMYQNLAPDAKTIRDEDAWNLRINPLGLTDAMRTDRDDDDRPTAPVVTVSRRW